MLKKLALVLSVLTVTTTTLSADCKTCESGLRFSTEDEEIFYAIHRRLQSHGYDYHQNHVHVSVNHGKVLFKGRVDSKREQELLRDIALDIPGVDHVIVNVYVHDIDPMKNKRISNKPTGPRH